MKAKKYRAVERLPENARTVKLYAQDIGVEPAYVYVKYQRAKGEGIGYDIVNFQGVNFVIPELKTA